MNRVLISKLRDHIGEEVAIAGFVDVRRDHGKLVFIDFRDRSGVIQTVISPKHESAYTLLKDARAEWVLEIRGVVKKRPENMVNSDIETGDIEIEVIGASVLNRAKELPFEKDAELNLDTYLDNLPLTLRNERSKNIFSVQATVVEAFREHMREKGFVEFQNPVLVGGDAEGGAAAFKVLYYNDKTAFLATSPQLYKQMMVPIFERVFTTAKVFRAEKHATSRHLSEVVQMDFEMGFIKSHEDVLDMLESAVRFMVSRVVSKHGTLFKKFGTEAPSLPERIPRLTLSEVQTILKDEKGIDCVGEPDLDPEHERVICEWALEKHRSDFVFVTRFPTSKRPFYTFIDEGNRKVTRSFDLLFRGLEINSGSQRVHDYDELVARIKEKGLNPETFSFYLQAFKYGMPPHGGCSTGLERFTARLLNLGNVKEATLFPREINRIDTLLSQ